MDQDQIDAAIDAVDEPSPRTRVNVTIGSTGSIVGIDFPNDLTEPELLEFVGWLGTTLLNTLRSRPAGPQLIIASRLPD